MNAFLAALLALAPLASAAPPSPADQRSSTDKKSKDVITEFGSNAELPPDMWSCPRRDEKTAADASPLQRASDLKCLTEWLWSVQRYYAAGGKAKKGVEPALVAAEKARAAALADGLSKWAAGIPSQGPGASK